jgi:hypothetical protein
VGESASVCRQSYFGAAIAQGQHKEKRRLPKQIYRQTKTKKEKTKERIWGRSFGDFRQRGAIEVS